MHYKWSADQSFEIAEPDQTFLLSNSRFLSYYIDWAKLPSLSHRPEKFKHPVPLVITKAIYLSESKKKKDRKF